MLLETTKPLANGGDGGGEQLRGGFDTALLGAFHQPQAMVVGVVHLTHQIEIPSGGGHRDRILHARPGSSPLRRAARPNPKSKSSSFSRFPLTLFNLARGIRCE